MVTLCQSATILIANPIQLTAANQTLQTQGLPVGNAQGDLRAIIRVVCFLPFAQWATNDRYLQTGLYQSNAITASCSTCNYATIQNIQVVRDLL